MFWPRGVMLKANISRKNTTNEPDTIHFNLPADPHRHSIEYIEQSLIFLKFISSNRLSLPWYKNYLNLLPS